MSDALRTSATMPRGAVAGRMASPPMSLRVPLVITGLAVLGGATSAAAQTAALDTRPALGAMVHAAFNSDQNVISDKQTTDFAVNADWPVRAGWRVRGEVGRAAWNFDGQAGLPAPLPTDRISITRVTASVMRRGYRIPGTYVGGGAGVYRYASELSPLPRRTRPGLHAIAGMEIGSSQGGLALRLEGQFQAVGGPNAAYDPGASPVTGVPANGSSSRVTSSVLLNLVFGIGIGWRF